MQGNNCTVQQSEPDLCGAIGCPSGAEEPAITRQASRLSGPSTRGTGYLYPTLPNTSTNL